MIQSKIPAFRDGYHFYYPQAVWLDQCWRLGELFPQWNRYEGLGTSVPGQASTALYYPLRAIWFLDFLSLPQRYAVFVVAHLLLAAAGMGYAAKRLRIQTASSRLAMVSFALSCPVLFQQYNLIYLCSAAWIGFSLGSLIDFLRHPNRFLPSLVIYVLSTCMMVLSGDPQTAVHSGIVSLLLIIGALFYRGNRVRLSLLRIGWLSLATAGVAALTVMQWLPAWRQSQLSNRVETAEIATNADLLPEHRKLQEQLSNMVLGRMRRYEFSLSPWHLPTAIWPTLGGHFQNENSRWFQAIGSEGRMWVPSIYFGFLPCLLCLWGWFNVRRQRWLAWLALFALAASLGNYSPIWLCRELLLSLGATDWAIALPADQTLSIYGLLAAVIPGYDSFRFPAKWTVWFTAATSLYAAVSLDAARRRKGTTRLPIQPSWLWWTASLSVLLAAVGAYLLTPWPQAWLAARLGSDPWLGPVTSNAIAKSICFSAVLVIAMLGLTTRLRSTHRTQLTLLTMLEMLLVASCWSNFVDTPSLDPPTTVATEEHANESATGFVWTNVMRANFASDTRGDLSLVLRQKQLQDRFLIGKLAEIVELRNLAASQSIESSVLEKLKLWLAAQDRMQDEQPMLDGLLAQLGVTHRLSVRENTGARELYWKAILDPRPMCELINEVVPAPSQPPRAIWNWQSSSRLLIEVSPPQTLADQLDPTDSSDKTRGLTLLVRQWNDGGWQAQAIVNGQRQVLRVNPAPTAFIEIDLPRYTDQVLLARKAFW